MWKIHKSLEFELKHEVLDSIWTAETIMFKNNLTTKHFHIYILKIETYNQLEAGSVWRGHLDQIYKFSLK